MANHPTIPHKPDGRVFASYPMPAKFDLINEKPRRESLIEKQLDGDIVNNQIPVVQVTESNFNTSRDIDRPSTNQTVARNVYTTIETVTTTNQTNLSDQGQTRQMPNLANNQSFLRHQESSSSNLDESRQMSSGNYMRPASATTSIGEIASSIKKSNNAAILAAELAEKEAKLMADITALHQRPYSPFQVPAKIDLSSEHRNTHQQYQNAPTNSRPQSRVSSTRCTSADLADKEAKLLQEIEEISKKPYNPQTMVVEREQWFEYPERNPADVQLTDSRRRVKDFCSMPEYMYPSQDRHIHEENLLTARPTSAASSIHTTIIRSPRREIDNKSPLPFAFDNFTTKGVRGNIATACAVEPERPRPPIYPIIKKSPSPNLARG